MKGGKGRKRKGERAVQETQVAKRRKILCEGSLSPDAEEIFEEESDDSVDSYYSTRVGEQKGQKSRREAILWTSIEKETIEAGVRLYWRPHDGKPIPWKRILEFGKGKFKPCRTNIDLKDKWRNMHGSRAARKSGDVPNKYCNPIELSSNREAMSSGKMQIKNENTKKNNKEKKEKKEKKIQTLGGRPIIEIEYELSSNSEASKALSSDKMQMKNKNTKKKNKEKKEKKEKKIETLGGRPIIEIESELSSNSEASKVFSSHKTQIKNKNTKKKNMEKKEKREKEEKKEKKEKKIETLGGRPINEIENEPSSDGQMFDPMKEIPADLVAAFKSWRDRPRSKKRKVQIRLPIAFKEVASPRWFDFMWIRRKWLSSEHVDSVMNLLIKKANNEPEMFLPRWTCVETICWYKMGLDNYDLGSRLMMKYVEGKLPKQGGKAWSEVDNIYGIAHLMESHWVTYNINIEEQRITVYDSLSRGSRWDEVKPAFENMSGCVPWLCKKGRVMEDRGFSGTLKDKWEVVRYEHPPQQENISDCGIMAIKFIECLASGHLVDYIDPGLCGDFRAYYCTELFDGGKKV